MKLSFLEQVTIGIWLLVLTVLGVIVVASKIVW